MRCFFPLSVSASVFLSLFPKFFFCTRRCRNEESVRTLLSYLSYFGWSPPHSDYSTLIPSIYSYTTTVIPTTTSHNYRTVACLHRMLSKHNCLLDKLPDFMDEDVKLKPPGVHSPQDSTVQMVEWVPGEAANPCSRSEENALFPEAFVAKERKLVAGDDDKPYPAGEERSGQKAKIVEPREASTVTLSGFPTQSYPALATNPPRPSLAACSYLPPLPAVLPLNAFLPKSSFFCNSLCLLA